MIIKKLYCYVDETGQDTFGKIFIVVSVVVDEEKHAILDLLTEAEKKSGKTRKKWIKTRDKERKQY